MSSPTQGMWTCIHGVDGRDWCDECGSGVAQDPEVQALETICETLAPLGTATCQRVISEVARRFGITLTPLGEQ